MGKFISIFMLLFSSIVSADPVLLYPMNCGTVRNCTHMPNSAGIENMSLYASTSYGFLTLNANGVQYIGKNYVAISIVGDVLTDPVSGRQVVLTIDYSYSRTLNRSGHNYWVNRYGILDGQVDGLSDAPNPFGVEPVAPVMGGCDGVCHR